MNNIIEGSVIKRKTFWNRSNAHVIGIIIFIIGLINLSDNFFVGLLIIFSSFVIIPQVYGKISKKLNLNWNKRIRILSAILLLAISGLILSTQSSKLEIPTASESTLSQSSANLAEVGDTGYIKFPGISDSEQIICLGPTKEGYEQIMKSIRNKDFIGIIEAGAFCVGNGTKVQVIDSSFTLKKVRVLEGSREIDKNLILKSGWIATEWVVKSL